ncbi:MAG: hypothetical protein ACOYCB_01840 [Fastidiosipilaceae bacterium]|jgi:hypothetical protein
MLTLAACGGGGSGKTDDAGSDAEVADTTVEEEAADEAGDGASTAGGELIDAGNVRAVCPTGWFNLEVQNSDGDGLDPNQLTFLKGAESASDLFNAASVMIVFHGMDNPVMDIRSVYEDIEELEPFEAGGRTWEGFKGVSMGYQYALLNREGSGEVQVMVLMENDNASIALDDPDFLTILETLDY